jgi:hypothetical protein
VGGFAERCPLANRIAGDLATITLFRARSRQRFGCQDVGGCGMLRRNMALALI